MQSSKAVFRLTALLLLLLPMFVSAEGFIRWQKPLEPSCHSDGGGHVAHTSKAKQFEMSDFKAETTYEISYIFSNLERQTLEHENGRVTIPRTGLNNYHVLVVLAKNANSVSSAIRYLYQHGKPSKISPAKLIHLQKSPLEILPSPLPREHDRYYGSKEYPFQLLFNTKALANTSVAFETKNGTTMTLKSDDKGIFSLTMPNDFSDVKKGRRANKAVDFVLKAKHEADGITYMTTLSMPYHVNPNDYWRHEGVAVLVALLGFAMGYFIIRRYVNTRRSAK